MILYVLQFCLGKCGSSTWTPVNGSQSTINHSFHQYCLKIGDLSPPSPEILPVDEPRIPDLQSASSFQCIPIVHHLFPQSPVTAHPLNSPICFNTVFSANRLAMFRIIDAESFFSDLLLTAFNSIGRP